jgi:hypothetical protein
MRIWIAVTLVIALLVSATVLFRLRLPAYDEAAVEQQAQVPAPGGVIWCKSADECPHKHVRRPD